MKDCNCSNIYYPLYDSSYDSCIIKINSSCSSDTLTLAQSDESFQKNCQKECPFECDKIEFNYVITTNEVFIIFK